LTSTIDWRRIDRGRSTGWPIGQMPVDLLAFMSTIRV
jgi:hypothetical protein